MGDLRLRTAPEYVGAERLARLTDYLLSQDREIPIAVLSRTERGEALIDAPELALRLAGLALVVQLEDSHGASKLTKLLAPQLALKSGSVRIFWPGLSRSDSEYSHRLFPPDRFRDALSRTHAVEEICNSIAGAAVYSISLDRRIGDLEHEVVRQTQLVSDRDRRNDLERLIAALTEAAENAQEPDAEVGWSELMQSLEQNLEDGRKAHEIEIEQYERTIAGMKSEHENENLFYTQFVKDVEDERDKYREHALKAEGMSQTMSKIRGDIVNHRSSMMEVFCDFLEARTLEELVNSFRELSPKECVRFLPDASSTARESGFSGSIQSAIELLARLVRAAELFHFNDRWTLAEAFKEASEPSLSADISETAKRKYQEDYVRRYDDGSGEKRILLGPHVKVGRGSSHKSIVIYFYVDERNRRLVIGHVGKHLRGKLD